MKINFAIFAFVAASLLMSGYALALDSGGMSKSLFILNIAINSFAVLLLYLRMSRKS